MEVLLLGHAANSLRETIKHSGDSCELTADKLDLDRLRHVDWLVSYGYRHKVQAPVLAHFGKRAINLHTSYLPWNKGAHPNFWSWLDDTPKGVTLHVMDEGIDTGPIIAQDRARLSMATTFAATYDSLHEAAVDLFRDTWPIVRDGQFIAIPQDPTAGSHHFVRDLPQHLLPNGWLTPIPEALASLWS